MLYQPRYCCHCGEKIERVEWFPWTSRRFCEVCETELKAYDWLPRILVGFGVLLSIFGLGSYLKSGNSDAPVAVRQTTSEAPKPSQISPNQKTVSQLAANTGMQQPAPASVNIQPVPQTPRAQKSQTEAAPVEAVYFCGAQTKKGTPCSRRVKGGGRCWQHEGQPAMLPPEKLIVSRN